MVVTRVGKLQELDLNLFCNDTVFYQLQDKIFDIDYMEDLDNFKKDDLND